MSNHLVILPGYIYAGHCTSDRSNKDWAACLAREVNSQDTQSSSEPSIDDTTEVLFLSLHGPHGGNLIVDQPKKLPMKQARAHFTKKCREKDHKAYAHVPFTSYQPIFQRALRALGVSLLVPEGLADGDNVVMFTPAPEPSTTPPLRYQVSVVKPLSWEQLQAIIVDPAYGITEKVNGERCILVFDGQHLTAYNRRGELMSMPPEGALSLSKLGSPFVIDGERLTGDWAGHFVAFDLLEWDHENFTAYSYGLRMNTLHEAMRDAGLLIENRFTPTFAEAQANSTEVYLALLAPTLERGTGPRIVEEVQAASGEGVVARRMLSDYRESPLKFKFVADLDAFVIAINEGSLKMGVFRPADGAIIEVANVRSGLTDADIRTVRQMLERGTRPVFTVTYLPKRTVGIQLVEPRTSMTRLRSDKSAAECSTDQFEAEKAPLIAQAQPFTGIVFS